VNLVFVLTTLDVCLIFFPLGTDVDGFHLKPFLRPILKTTSNGLQAASGEVINSHDQYEVFNDPRAVSPFLNVDIVNTMLIF